MAKKKSRAKPTTLDSLAKLITRTSASADKNFSALAEDIADIKSTMATKADVYAIVREELAPIRAELKSIRRDLNDLTDKFENISGFRKEIDHALERIAVIEKHLGLGKKFAT